MHTFWQTGSTSYRNRTTIASSVSTSVKRYPNKMLDSAGNKRLINRKNILYFTTSVDSFHLSIIFIQQNQIKHDSTQKASFILYVCCLDEKNIVQGFIGF